MLSDKDLRGLENAMTAALAPVLTVLAEIRDTQRSAQVEALEALGWTPPATATPALWPSAGPLGGVR